MGTREKREGECNCTFCDFMYCASACLCKKCYRRAGTEKAEHAEAAMERVVSVWRRSPWTESEMCGPGRQMAYSPRYPLCNRHPKRHTTRGWGSLRSL